jgi:3-dehydroquinate synthase
MKSMKVAFDRNAYEIHIGAGLMGRLSEKLKELGFKDKVVIITNPTVKGLYGWNIEAGLKAAGFNVALFEAPDGEAYKSLKLAGDLYQKLNSFQAERMTPVLALGGGVIGDLAGFVAATYMRGVPLIQVPTTLLAQVDSSIGGKVAVNHGQLKNTIGAFYQPKLVLSDIATLKTLPIDDLGNGLAEIIKYAVITDHELFTILIKGMQRIKSLDLKLIEEVISRCAGIKSKIVEKDENDLGMRNILNFGHTFGHAFETVSNFQMPHGRAVAVGMIAAAMVSQRMNVLPYSVVDAIKKVIVSAGLPINIPILDIHKVMDAMAHDKKKTGGRISFVLPKGIGEVFITDEVDNDLIRQVLKELHEETPDLCHSGGE